MDAGAAFRRRQRSSSGPIVLPRLGPLGLAFLLTLIWFVANLRRPAPLDILPFAWLWLTLWLAVSVAADLFDRLDRRIRTHRRS